MESISPSELAVELLNHCLRGAAWPEELLDVLTDEALDEDPALAAPATRALFSVLVERLSDLFEPRLCDVYAALFARVVERARPELKAKDLVSRYQAVRQVRPPSIEPKRVVVLSRVTLGADVAVTSIVMDGARQRYPEAELLFAGPKKAWELFEASPRFRHLDVAYGRRGLLADRLEVYEPLKQALADPGTLVLDPDSRLTQLGLLPVCDAERHHLFESRSFGGDSELPLPELARAWVRDTLNVDDAEPWLHPKYQYDYGSRRVFTCSLGVGENPAKRLEDPFEEELLRLLAARSDLLLVDAGAPGSEEEERVKRAIERSGAAAERIGLHQGSFASFAAMIGASSFYAGYDSAGQHVAAALGVPLLTVFAGFANDRMCARWSPASFGPATVLKAGYQSDQDLWASVQAAIPE